VGKRSPNRRWTEAAATRLFSITPLTSVRLIQSGGAANAALGRH